MKILEDNKKIKAFIFDLDGTLLDSMSLWQEVDRKYLANYGIQFNPKFSEAIKKMTFDESAKYFIEQFKIPKSEAEIKSDWNQMVEIEYRYHIKCKRFADEIVKMLAQHKIKLCIATSCNKEHAIMALKRLQLLDYFEFVLTCNEVGRNKESPDIYIECAKKMQLAHDECFVVEDLFMALCVAQKEGFKTIGVYDPLSVHEKEGMEEISDYYIHDFKELQ